jgi:hypothetical protein
VYGFHPEIPGARDGGADGAAEATGVGVGDGVGAPPTPGLLPMYISAPTPTTATSAIPAASRT